MPFIHTLYAQVSHAQKNCASNMDQIAVKGVPASCHIPGRKELGQRQPQNKESSSVVGFLRARGQGSSEGFFLPPQCKVGWKRDKKEGVFLLFCFLFFLDHHAGNWFLFTNPCSPNVYSWPQLILWNVCFYPIQKKKKGGGQKNLLLNKLNTKPMFGAGRLSTFISLLWFRLPSLWYWMVEISSIQICLWWKGAFLMKYCVE